MTDTGETTSLASSVCSTDGESDGLLDRLADPIEAFDLEAMPRATRDAWLTYCAMRKCLSYFLYLHADIGPMVYATEHSYLRSRPDAGILGRFNWPDDQV